MSRKKTMPHPAKSERTQGSEKISERAEEKAGRIPVGQGQNVEERLEAAESKAKENYDRLLRITAEFENYKKRMEREMNEFRKFANEALMKDILPTVDNLQRALETPPGDQDKAADGMREGLEMTLKGLLGSLEKHGVEPIEALKKPFDPNFHHAVMQEESDKYPENTVSQELQRGYMIRDRLLRPAMVVVSKKPEPKKDAGAKKSERGQKIEIKIH